MLKWIKSWGTKSPSLNEILSDPFHREGFLGVRNDPMPTPEKMIGDNNKVINYARTEDYAVFANELWAKVLNCIDELIKPEQEPSKSDFYRGALAANIENLRISYKAILLKKESVDQSRRNS
jgi:hypothetical protein